MRKVVLYRRCNSKAEDNEEIEALQKAGFVYLRSRTQIQKGDLVIPRYCCDSYYNELAHDVELLGGKLLNSLEQHRYVADLGNYVRDLKELTPETWEDLQNIPEDGPFVLKGGTNSKKSYWHTQMFARNKKEAIEVHGKLLSDSVIGEQPIYIRKFIPLHTYYLGVTGMPVTKEFRLFICDGKVLCGDFYWSNEVEEFEEVPRLADVPYEALVEQVIRRIGDKIRAYVVDVWVTAEGQPIAGELNDLQQSGLSMNKPEIFYNRLMEVLLDSE